MTHVVHGTAGGGVVHGMDPFLFNRRPRRCRCWGFGSSRPSPTSPVVIQVSSGSTSRRCCGCLHSPRCTDGSFTNDELFHVKALIALLVPVRSCAIHQEHFLRVGPVRVHCHAQQVKSSDPKEHVQRKHGFVRAGDGVNAKDVAVSVHHNMSSGPQRSSQGTWTPVTRSYSSKVVLPTPRWVCLADIVTSDTHRQTRFHEGHGFNRFWMVGLRPRPGTRPNLPPSRNQPKPPMVVPRRQFEVGVGSVHVNVCDFPCGRRMGSRPRPPSKVVVP